MGRPLKSGIDYFPLDCNFMKDIKVRKILRACGPGAIAVIVNLLCTIYQGDGYYMLWDEDTGFLIADDVGVKESFVHEVVKTAVQVDFFHAGMFDTRGILTSAGIQRRYKEATARRNNNALIADYNLLSNELCGVIAYNNSVNVDNNSINVDKSTQMIVDDSKVNKIRVDDDIGDTCAQKLAEIIGSSSSDARNFLCHFKPEDRLCVVEQVEASEYLKKNLDVHRKPSKTFMARLLSGNYRTYKKTSTAKASERRTDGYSAEELNAMARRRFQNKVHGGRDDSGADGPLS
ncbi:DUF4373 domain-containing protein [Aedoeadaptatus acetigenes]|uniref:DUF4373 domain-containing protein n=1 Tax=Aedoeadaptatus acetigenes TaxID=2981723 RepID=A0ABV1J474_9FIRM